MSMDVRAHVLQCKEVTIAVVGAIVRNHSAMLAVLPVILAY
jgi:hypothetical protein